MMCRYHTPSSNSCKSIATISLHSEAKGKPTPGLGGVCSVNKMASCVSLPLLGALVFQVQVCNRPSNTNSIFPALVWPGLIKLQRYSVIGNHPLLPCKLKHHDYNFARFISPTCHPHSSTKKNIIAKTPFYPPTSSRLSQ
ncbi:hypothetical protein XENOCAPTIV_010665 [Xenoophorus captivus]|uniref:Uncharacterized protein n=1 Tax=Xenoophorus captivus TaxID=1517983 RepID=A0ABV0RYS9_9TELE